MWGLSLVVVVLLGCVKSPCVDACSVPIGWRPPTLEEIINDANEVLFAHVLKTFPDETGLYWRANLYTAEVEVFCILKGQQTTPIVNITDVGFIPGMCIATSLEVDGNYLILADVVDDAYKAKQTRSADWDKVHDVANMCGIQKLYPFGVEEESVEWICPTPSPPDDCESEDSEDSSPSTTD